MPFKMVPVKNQKFEIGRTINPFNCDCKKCDFMNCPKNNYAVKMTKKIWELEDYWKIFKEEILALNKPYKWQYSFHDSYDLELNYRLIEEFIDMLFNFPRGTYWSPGDKKWYVCDNVSEQVYRKILIQKVSRSGNIVNLGEININNGKYFDLDLSTAQERLAIKISNALKNLKELVFAHYQELDKDWVIGWLSPEGRYFPCRNTEHSILAQKLGNGEILLERNGWVKIALHDTYFFMGRNMTAEQRNWLSLNGFELEE